MVGSRAQQTWVKMAKSQSVAQIMNTHTHTHILRGCQNCVRHTPSYFICIHFKPTVTVTTASGSYLLCPFNRRGKESPEGLNNKTWVSNQAD